MAPGPPILVVEPDSGYIVIYNTIEAALRRIDYRDVADGNYEVFDANGQRLRTWVDWERCTVDRNWRSGLRDPPIVISQVEPPQYERERLEHLLRRKIEVLGRSHRTIRRDSVFASNASLEHLVDALAREGVVGPLS